MALGNFSTDFKFCYETVDNNVYRFWLFIAHYESIVNYLLHLVPNLLSYTFLIPQWINKIEQLDDEKDYVTLTYVYCVICRRLIFYEFIPDDENSDLTIDKDPQTNDPLDLQNDQSNNFIRQRKGKEILQS